MAEITNIHKLKYSAAVIDDRLEKAGNAVLKTKFNWEDNFDTEKGTKIGTLTFGETENDKYAIYAPEVKWTPNQEVQGGTKIGTLTFGETENEIYAPAAEGGAELPTISGTVTNAVGGINKDKIYTDASIADVLTDLLFPYVAPSNLTISTSAASGTFEYGTEVVVTKVTPYFTLGSKPITSIKIGTTYGENDLYSGATATSGTAIPLTNSKTFRDGRGGTIYCTITDEDNKSDYASASVYYEYYTYYAVTDTTDLPTSWTSVGSTAETGIEIKAQKGQYIWIASTSDLDIDKGEGICQLNELTDNKYNAAAPTSKKTNQTLVNKLGHECVDAYNFYRLVNPRAADTDTKFKLGKGDV